MTYSMKRLLPRPGWHSQFLRLALIGLVLIALHAAPARGQQWNTNGNNISNANTGGNVGIGTTNPTSRLVVGGDGQQTELQGDLLLSRSGSYPYIYTNHSTHQIRIRTGGSGKLVFQSDTATGAVEVGQAGNIVTFQAYGTAYLASNSGNVGIGTTNPQVKLDVNGNTNVAGNVNVSASGSNPGNITAAGTIEGNIIKAKYQDVAEWVPASEHIPAGTVVVLDSTRSNHVISSTRRYDTRVAGVISAQPGIALGESGDSKVLVATTGRVRIKVDASSGPIQIGDLLVTSNAPGLAMKSEPVNLGGVQLHRPGTLIGKALEPLAKGSGTILVLLSLQ